MFWRLLCWVVVWLCFCCWILHGFEIFVTSLQFSNEHRFFYLKLPLSFGEKYLNNQYCSLITDITVSLECAWAKSQIWISESWGPQICSITFRWDVSVRHSLIIFSKAGVQLFIFRIAIRQIGKWSWLLQGIVYDLFLLTLCNIRTVGLWADRNPEAGPRVLIAHLNEEKKMFGNKTIWFLEYPALLLFLSWAVYFNALYLDINFFHNFFLPKTCSYMMQVAILDVQVVSVPPQVTFMPVWILLLPEPDLLHAAMNPCLLFDPIAGDLLLSDGEVFALLLGLNSAAHPLQPWYLMQSWQKWLSWQGLLFADLISVREAQLTSK